jgi:hypothetical protein
LPAGIARWFLPILVGMSGNVAAATHPHTFSFPPMSATQNSAVETGTTRPICKEYMYL